MRPSPSQPLSLSPYLTHASLVKKKNGINKSRTCQVLAIHSERTHRRPSWCTNFEALELDRSATKVVRGFFCSARTFLPPTARLSPYPLSFLIHSHSHTTCFTQLESEEEDERRGARRREALGRRTPGPRRPAQAGRVAAAAVEAASVCAHLDCSTWRPSSSLARSGSAPTDSTGRRGRRASAACLPAPPRRAQTSRPPPSART